jgi:hypothetical protein
VQIIEVTELAGVRSSVVAFRRKGSGLRFVLYPMIHLGEPSFYEAVSHRTSACDILIMEGVGRSSRVRAITTAYRWAAGSSGLVVQNLRYTGDGTPPHLICPDMTREEFDRRWSRIALRIRVTVLVLAPCYGLMMRVLGPRRAMARLSTDEVSDYEDDDFTSDKYQDLDDLILRARDRLVVDALAELHEHRSDQELQIGVVYGAGHMPAVIQALWTLGYRPYAAEWLTVFSDM